MWACSITPFRFSMPGVAGLRMMTFPVLSTRTSIWCFWAKETKNARTFSSCLEGLGCRVNAWKLAQTALGSSCSMFLFMVLSLVFCLQVPKTGRLRPSSGLVLPFAPGHRPSPPCEKARARPRLGRNARKAARATFKITKFRDTTVSRVRPPVKEKPVFLQAAFRPGNGRATANKAFP